MKIINKEAVVFCKCSDEVQRDLRNTERNGGKVYIMNYEGEWVLIESPEFFKSETYKAEFPEKKLTPWTVHKFMNKYIRKKTWKNFYIVYRIDYENKHILANGDHHNIKYWFENGECLNEDGSIGPCGDEVVECI